MKRIFVRLVCGVSAVLLSAAFVWAAEVQRQKSEALFQHAPPQVTDTTPVEYFPDYTTDLLDSVRIEFGVPVDGVRAKDLSVNGSHAKQVTGIGAGPYVFKGYTVPGPGRVEIKVAPGEIRRKDYGTRFEGYSWEIRAFEALADDDGDGLTNEQEIKVHSDPTKRDTDGDGLPDPYELSHPCLMVFWNEALPQNDYGVIRPGNDDTDHDGISNLEEYQRGTDPCSPR